MRTGFYANGPRRSRVHIVALIGGRERPICKYRPAASMSFQWCANGAHLNYVDCDKCGAIMDRRRSRLP